MHRPAVEDLPTHNVLYWTPSSFRRQVPNTDTFPDTSDVQTLVLVVVEVWEADKHDMCLPLPAGDPQLCISERLTQSAILHSQEGKGLHRDRGL